MLEFWDIFATTTKNKGGLTEFTTVSTPATLVLPVSPLLAKQAEVDKMLNEIK
jgi:hypothetical protein